MDGILVLASMFLIGCFGWGVHHQVDVAVSVNEPYTDYSIDELDSYGVWNSMPPYGRVWRPNVAREWTPFYYGHWTYAEPIGHGFVRTLWVDCLPLRALDLHTRICLGVDT